MAEEETIEKKPEAKSDKQARATTKKEKQASAMAGNVEAGAMGGNETVKLVHDRNIFYRDSHQRLLTVLLISVIVSALSVAILLHIVLNPPSPKYFAVTADGRITPITALNIPNLSTSAVLQWANQAAIAAYSYNFVNYRKELQAASEFFTPEGWQLFIQALTNSNNLTAIKSKKLIVSAVAQGAPIILWQGIDPKSGRYAWRVQIPILVTYQSSSQISQQRLVVNMLIVRVSTLFSVRGIGIDQFVAASG